MDNQRRILALSLLAQLPTKWKCYFSYKPSATRNSQTLIKQNLISRKSRRRPKAREFMNPRLIPNFVVAHAEFLPFKDECFDVAFSSHTIEHVKNPLKMMQELLRVSKRQVTVRCPHRKGSGAKRPFHINYLDEDWFNVSLARLGFKTQNRYHEC